ncbi:Hypothetical predicted protein [Podarcis lilfordi]|uniref:Uncharacterized protein n=1 Tax=Podarcis lilfordi TaxID=74358 RepID=A0AA35L435_9SAUR|nr:Hypothetical predicted protein [Podarcis lilfordi]
MNQTAGVSNSVRCPSGKGAKVGAALPGESCGAKASERAGEERERGRKEGRHPPRNGLLGCCCRLLCGTAQGFYAAALLFCLQFGLAFARMCSGAAQVGGKRL